ncbi:MAG TPA: Gfo/Idh/MocA family oxidoreductase, partial [Pyrinomonadaceae bacterium]|nr:Gfo/Idh/MocA family oxidoreductase [Pyrinomonadaceae bacterium]
KLKIGIIGAGYMGGVHAGILARDDRVQILAVHDIETESGKRLANTYGARIAESAAEVIGNCDAVYITTPNTKHTDVAIAATGAGKHVFCEKPMATSLADAHAVLDAANKSNAVFQVGHNRRFAPVYATLKQLLTENHPPHSAHVKLNRGELLHPQWVGDPSITGGFLYETTIHMFDMMRFLFGEVSMLHAIGSSHEYPETDDFSVLLKFDNGLHATFASSADASWLFPFERVEVFSHHATLVTSEMDSLVYTESVDGKHFEQSMLHLSKEEKWGYVQEDKSFVDSILSASPPAVTAFDGLKAVELVEGCYRSVKTPQPVKFAVDIL